MLVHICNYFWPPKVAQSKVWKFLWHFVKSILMSCCSCYLKKMIAVSSSYFHYTPRFLPGKSRITIARGSRKIINMEKHIRSKDMNMSTEEVMAIKKIGQKIHFFKHKITRYYPVRTSFLYEQETRRKVCFKR